MPRKVMIISLAILFSLSIFGIQVITEEREIFVADELEKTRLKPDVLIVDNGLFKVELVPNRGRILWQIFPRDNTKKGLLYNRSDYPMPFLDEITTAYIFEIGGVYVSVPWNDRSNQPYPLKYSISEKENEVSIEMEGLNEVEGLHNTITVKIKENDPEITVRMTIKNVEKKPKEVKLWECVNFNMEEPLRLISDNPFLADKTLDDFEKYTYKEIKDSITYIGVKNPLTNESFKMNLNDKKTMIAQLWGKDWQLEMGGIPALRFIIKHNVLTLEPNETYSIKQSFEFMH
ncbi:hypothetical protein [Petrotoga sp. SL27]|uniref:hypothetical protein n=1 Tax=Petrotoga sp. SL27 TaxID=1445612 RepID=UPI000CDF2942|nr:hypothetical protein [Petrotoga sp. SL27]POZ91614.1 hypothetical protein AD60_02480 [Petrotoga sp. SL27]